MFLKVAKPLRQAERKVKAKKNAVPPYKTPVYLKSLPSRPPARLFTMPPPSALLAYVEAWLNRSQREKAKVFVTVKTSAIAGRY